MKENVADFPQLVTLVGEDSDSHEYTLQDGEETLNDDWTAECQPGRTYIWKNCSKFYIVPPIPEPPSFQFLGQMVARTPAWVTSVAASMSEDADSNQNLIWLGRFPNMLRRRNRRFCHRWLPQWTRRRCLVMVAPRLIRGFDMNRHT
jgi:hypothetical protein